jgi:hypothetical protein
LYGRARIAPRRSTTPSRGGTSRVLTSKLTDTVSVIDLGADKTGSADSTAAFQAVVASGKSPYIPCGTYKLVGTVTVAAPSISVEGESESCVTINYTGSASAFVWQMVPFTITPAGEFANFTLIGTSAALNGILSGQIVASRWRNLAVMGFTGAGAAAIHLHNAGTLITWTERNTFDNVSVGGRSGQYNTNGFLLTSGNSADSFGYNRFLDVKMNCSTGQVCFNFSSGFFYNSFINLVCNSDNNVAGSTGAICVRSNGNWDSNKTLLNGEFQNTGSGSGTAYAVQVESGARFANLPGSNVNVFAPGSTILTVNNLAGASNSPNVTLQEPNGNFTGWDTGTFTLSGVSTVPEVNMRGNFGSMGMLIGNNIESPYVTMYNGTGNKFVVGSVQTGLQIGQMVDVFDVSTFGDATASSTLNVVCGALSLAGCNSPGGIDGSAAGRIAGYTSGHRTGWTNLFFAGTNGINEQLGLSDTNFQAGIGSVLNTNVAHPMAWAYNIDPVDFEWYEKPFQTPLVGGGVVASMLHGGSLSLRGHLDQQSGNNNIAGTCSTSGSTSCAFGFTTTFANAPICVASPQSDPGVGIRWWVTSSTSACTVTTSAVTSIAWSFIVAGNPN